MILQFPDLDTLHLVLAGHAIEDAVSLAPAVVSYDSEGRPTIEPEVTPARATLENLRKLGVKSVRKHSGETDTVSTWLQVLPTLREASLPVLSSQAPVLFEIADADDVPVLVSEMLRLGNDRQSYRWLADPAKPESPHALLRVLGPPYYTLLRALDRDSDGRVRAYIEKAPRVWVEIGYSHPIAGRIRVAEGQSVLIRSPRSWQFLDDEPFRDVYDLLRFELPTGITEWEAAENPPRIEVPLRLAAGNAADVPEFWVLRENAVEQLDSLVRDFADTLTSRLMFAIAEDANGQTLAILRTRPSKLAPPVLALENAVAFKPYFKLTNLYIPVGRRLHPPLRRDAVRHLLAEDPDQVVWLMPGEETGSFSPMSLADGSFRALEDWVDYVTEANQTSLSAWIESTRFEFESFVCREGQPKPPGDPGNSARGKEAGTGSPGELPVPAMASNPGEVPPQTTGTEFSMSVRPPDAWRQKRKEIEDAFLSIEGTLDAPARQSLWPSLAAANAGAGDSTEAAICWLNAMWSVEELPAAWTTGWSQSERSGHADLFTAEEFDRRLKQENPTPGDARALAAGFLELAAQVKAPAWFVSQLPAMQAYLEANERLMPVRAAWLVGYRLALLAGHDTLGLARLRDRLLQRLLEVGLSPERDLPGFLRYSGLRDLDRLRALKDKILDLHAVVRKWTEHVPVNLPYVDLYFSFALARLGESAESRRLLEAGRAAMQIPIPGSGDTPIKQAVAKNALFVAFEYRIEEALAGRSHAGLLPEEVVSTIQRLVQRGATKSSISTSGSSVAVAVSNPDYPVDRLRQESRVLEPLERRDAYSNYSRKADPFKDALEQLTELRDARNLQERVRTYYAQGIAGQSAESSRVRLLGTALPLAVRVGESFALELLDKSLETLQALERKGKEAESADDVKHQAELVERALQLAGLYELNNLVAKLVDRFLALVLSKTKDETRFELIHRVAADCLRSLRKFHLNAEVDRLLGRLQVDVIRGATAAELRQRFPLDSSAKTWAQAMQSLVHIAGGWLMFDLPAKATPILDDARAALLGKTAVTISVQHYTNLVRAYLSTVGLGPYQTGLERFFEFFRTMDRSKITNTTTTSPYYSRLHLEVVEALIWALVSDDFALGQNGRRWLDDDEYLVRHRIHRDFHRVLEATRE